MSASILVVDDEQDVRQFLRDLLTDEGYSVRVAEDAAAAWERIAERQPDLILLDLLMPSETGTGLYRRLRRKGGTKEIPVIVISALAGREVAVSRSVPVFDKPIDADGLLKAVGRVLGGEQAVS